MMGDDDEGIPGLFLLATKDIFDLLD